MTKKFPKYIISLIVLLIGAFGQLQAHSETTFAAIPTANTVSTDKTVSPSQEVRLFVVKPYTPQFEKHVKIEVTNIEDEDEDELNHDNKLNFGKNYVELDQFYNSFITVAFSEQLGFFHFSRTFSPLSLRSLNISFCVFRI